jgi:uncharacterized protein involved in exopolysaccharide biosynthesis
VILSPTYEASARILLNTSDLIVPVADAPPISDFEKLTTFNTQKDIIKSTTILSSVVDKLHLDKTRVIGNIEKVKLFLKGIKRSMGNLLGIKSWMKKHDKRAASIDAVLKNLRVETSPDSRAIKISYRSKDPKEAADTLNTVLKLYISYFNSLITQRASGITSYLKTRVKKVRKELTEAEGKLLALMRKDKVYLSVNKGKTNKRDGDSLLGIAGSQRVQSELKVYILAMEDELRKKLTSLARTDPAVVSLKRKIRMYLDALNSVPEKQLQLTRLKRELKIKEDAYLFLQKNYEKARIVQAGNTNKINIITVLDKAQADDNPVTPKTKLAIVFAIFFGALFGLILAVVRHYMDHTIRSVQDVSKSLGLKTIGSIEKLQDMSR